VRLVAEERGRLMGVRGRFRGRWRRQYDEDGYAVEDATETPLSALRRLPALHPDGGPEARVQALQLTLPPPPAPAGTYNRVVLLGDLLYVSGAWLVGCFSRV
jgi:hypothetical protein